VFLGAVDRFKTSRAAFRSKFANMIQLFNELNETEIKMLEGTQESIENLKKNIKEYNELHALAKTNEKKKVITDAQTDDMEIQYGNAQRNMAIMGIGAIGALLTVFNYMKNS
jgi:rRNA maturation endonuclease Nob1